MYSLEEIVVMNSKVESAPEDTPVRVIRKPSREPAETCQHVYAEPYNEGSDYSDCPTCGRRDIYMPWDDDDTYLP